MRQPTYILEFSTEAAAADRMLQKNRAAKLAGCSDLFCLVDGPADNYAVVDLRTAIELGGRYSWSV